MGRLVEQVVTSAGALPVTAEVEDAPAPISGFGGRFVRAAHKRRGVAFGLTQRINVSVESPMEGSFAAFRASRADLETNNALARVATEAKRAAQAAVIAVKENEEAGNETFNKRNDGDDLDITEDEEKQDQVNEATAELKSEGETKGLESNTK